MDASAVTSYHFRQRTSLPPGAPCPRAARRGLAAARRRHTLPRVPGDRVLKAPPPTAAADRPPLALAPHDALVLNNAGVTLMALGRTDEAAAALGQAHRADPADAGTLCNLAAAREAQGQADEAARLYGEALRLRPALPE